MSNRSIQVTERKVADHDIIFKVKSNTIHHRDATLLSIIEETIKLIIKC
eukprot:SAG31_NODE_44898_length_261_cov_0.586420_1_plen_48_part_10